MKRLVAGFLFASLGFTSGAVHAELPNEHLMCRPDEPRMDKFAYLRALSLDIRGDVPTSEEYADLATNHADVPETLIENWLSNITLRK